MFLCRVDYGHAEAAHKYGSDPRKYNVMSKKFVTDDKGHVRVSRPLWFVPCSVYFTLQKLRSAGLVGKLWCGSQGLLSHN